jgi:hypothetical protein
MTENYETTMVNHAAVLAAVDPLRSTVKVEPKGRLANGEAMCFLTVTGPDMKALADALHFKDGKKLPVDATGVRELNTVAMMTAIHKAISRIKAGEIADATIKAWEVCRG